MGSFCMRARFFLYVAVKFLSVFGEISIFPLHDCKGIIGLLFFGTFAGVFSPENVAVLAIFWNICRRFSGVCC